MTWPLMNLLKGLEIIPGLCTRQDCKALEHVGQLAEVKISEIIMGSYRSSSAQLADLVVKYSAGINAIFTLAIRLKIKIFLRIDQYFGPFRLASLPTCCPLLQSPSTIDWLWGQRSRKD